MKASLKRSIHRLTGMIRWVGVLLLGALIGLGAGRYVVDRPTGPTGVVAIPDIIRVEAGTLGRTLRLPAIGAWDVGATVRTPASGVITAIPTMSGLLKPGAVLLRVDERPLVVIPGDVPAFRELRVGTSGRDVDALQRHLASLDYKVDARLNRYSKVTAAAVRRWQSALGIPRTGIVALGDVMFIPPTAFPMPVRLTEAVSVGATLVAGTPIVERLAPWPTLTIEFGGSPPAQLEPGVAGEVTFPNGDRRAVTLSTIRREEGRTWATLDPVGDALCLVAECLDLVPPIGETPVDVEFTLVRETSGPMIPVAAIRSDAGGRGFVELPDGTRRAVTVVVVFGGSAIVNGMVVGDEIVLP